MLMRWLLMPFAVALCGCPTFLSDDWTIVKNSDAGDAAAPFVDAPSRAESRPEAAPADFDDAGSTRPSPEAASGNPPADASCDDCTSLCTSTCSGCCDSTGACNVGQSDMTCGFNGGACADCTSMGRVCQSGLCETPGNVDSGPMIDAGPGPSCGPLASRTTCASNQVCCANLSNYMNACGSSSSCPSNATLACSTASDCPSSAPICCAKLSLVADTLNDLPPKCTATGLSASCAASCNDSPPADATTCKYPPAGGSGLVRLCSHDTDCASDTANNACYNFNSCPVSWCSAAPAALEGVHQP